MKIFYVKLMTRDSDNTRNINFCASSDNTPQPLPVLESEIPDLVHVFQILATRNAYRRVLQVFTSSIFHIRSNPKDTSPR